MKARTECVKMSYVIFIIKKTVIKVFVFIAIDVNVCGQFVLF